MTKATILRHPLAVVVATAAALAAALIAASVIGAREADPAHVAPASTPPPARVPSRTFPGIPQRGLALGAPDAPVTLVEYADLQCPYCAQWATETLPVLVEEYVRTGKVRIVFNGMAFIGPDSRVALETVLAASRQNRLWDVLDAFFRRQGPENSGWVDEATISEVATSVRGLDRRRLAADRRRDWVVDQMERASASARRAGVTGTPSFAVGRTGGPLQLVELTSLAPEALRPALEAALAP